MAGSDSRRGGSQSTRPGGPLSGASPGGRNQHRGCDPQPGIESGVAALCDLMREGVLLDAASIPLEANGQTSWFIDQAFPATDTSDFAGSVRCGRGGTVQRRGPGNGPRQPHLRHASGGAGPGDAGSGIDAAVVSLSCLRNMGE